MPQRSQFLNRISRLRGALVLVLIAVCCATSLLAVGAREVHTSRTNTHFTYKNRAVKWLKRDAPTDATCLSTMNMLCYSPDELRTAYDVNFLTKAGLNGRGQTIVIIDSFGGPTVLNDLQQFDKGYNLPDPPSFKVLAPLGTKPFDANNSDMVGWAQETDLDVQWAHAIAPGANIVLLTSPVSETQGVQGMPQFYTLLKYALDNHLGNIISQSWGTTEETLFNPAGKQILDEFNALYKKAGAMGVTVFASVGDSGVLNPDVNNVNYNYPTVDFPASSPYVTAVGGTTLNADTSGNYQSESAWNSGLGSATGGGFSRYFKALPYQFPLHTTYGSISHGYRGLPDVSYAADPSTSVPIYTGFTKDTAGYYLFGGTSAGAPQWAALIAITNQIVGHPLGFINPDLYAIGRDTISFHDIVSGNNNQGTVKGFYAAPGWDPASGWGSPRASFLIANLIRSHFFH